MPDGQEPQTQDCQHWQLLSLLPGCYATYMTAMATTSSLRPQLGVKFVAVTAWVTGKGGSGQCLLS